MYEINTALKQLLLEYEETGFKFSPYLKYDAITPYITLGALPSTRAGI